MEVKKLKVLCLHGYLTNKSIMQMQLKEWERLFGKLVDFQYFNGKHVVTPAEVIDPRLKRIIPEGENTFAWLQFRTGEFKEDLQNDIQFLVEIIENNGYFDGIIGFSQGGNAINALIQQLDEGQLQLKHKPKFCIFINTPLMSLPQRIAQHNLPSIHFTSQEDQLYERQMLLTTFFKSPIVLEHSFGHRVPRLVPKEIAIIKKFFLRFVDNTQKGKIDGNQGRIQNSSKQTPKL